MSAQDVWEGMVLVDAGMIGVESMPYRLDDPMELIEFLDEESETRALGRNAVIWENEEVLGTYLH